MIYEATDYWNSSYISHHGVKGMKWGIRHDKPRLSRKQRRLAKSDYGKAKTMSNQELQQAINRINLEQNYISAVERDRAAYKEATSNILMRAGRRTVRSIYDKFLNVGVSTVNIGGQLTRNAVINSANKAFPITKKPKK